MAAPPDGSALSCGMPQGYQTGIETRSWPSAAAPHQAAAAPWRARVGPSGPEEKNARVAVTTEADDEEAGGQAGAPPKKQRTPRESTSAEKWCRQASQTADSGRKPEKSMLNCGPSAADGGLAAGAERPEAAAFYQRAKAART